LAFGRTGVDYHVSTDISDFVTELWRHQPLLVVLVVGGVALFVLVVVDTYRHRRKRKKERPSIKRHQ